MCWQLNILLLPKIVHLGLDAVYVKYFCLKTTKEMGDAMYTITHPVCRE